MATTNITINVGINAAGAQAGAQQMTQILSQIVTASQNAASQSASMFQRMFGAEFFAGLARDAVSSFMSMINELTIGSTLYAARTEELGVALEATAKASGVNIQVLREQEYAIKQLNITTQDARQTLSRFVAAQLDVAESGKLARVAQDLAVIAGVSSSEELNKLMIGIQTLQSRNLRSAGVFMTVDEVLDRLAKTTGRARDSFSTLEKQQAVLNAVLEYGSRVAGTYEASMETASKQIRSMERLAYEAQNALGAMFQGILTVGVGALSWLLENMQQHPKIWSMLTMAVTELTLAFIFLNTNAISGLITALTAGVGMMRGMLVSAGSLTGALHALAAAEWTAASAGAALAATLGSIFAIAGIVTLVVSLGAAFYQATSNEREFVKVADSVITGAEQKITAYKAQKAALDAYIESLAEQRKYSEGIGLVRTFGTQNAQAGKARSDVSAGQAQIASLIAEKETLEQQLRLSVSNSSGINLNAEKTSDLRKQLSEVNKEYEKGLEVQDRNNKKLEEASKLRDMTLNSLRNYTEANGVNEETLSNWSRSQDKANEIVKASIPGFKAQVAALGEVGSEYERLSKVLERQAEIEQKGLVLRGQAILANVQLAEEGTKKATDSQKRSQDSLTRDYELRARLERDLERFTRLNATGLSKGMAESAGNFGPQVTDTKNKLAALNLTINANQAAMAKNDSTIGEASAKTTEYGRQLVLVRDSMKRLNPDVEMTTESFYKLMGGETGKTGVNGTGKSFNEFSEILKKAEGGLRNMAQEAEDAALGIFNLDSALKSLKFPEFDAALPEQKMGEYIKRLNQQYGNFQKGLEEGSLPQTGIDPVTRFVQGAEGGLRRLTKEITDNYIPMMGGDTNKAITEAMKWVKDIPEDQKPALEQMARQWVDAHIKQQQAMKNARDANKEHVDKTKTELERLSESLRKSKDDINSFLQVGSQEWKLRMEVEEAERFRKDLENIVTLRREMGMKIDDALPADPKKAMALREELERQKKVFDQIKSVADEIKDAELQRQAAYKTAYMPVVDAEVRAQTALLNLVRERRNEEQQLASDIAVAIRTRMETEEQAGRRVSDIQGRAFLDRMNRERAAQEDVLRASIELDMERGNFDFAQFNDGIQEALRIANDPVASAIMDGNTTTKEGYDYLGTRIGESMNQANRDAATLESSTSNVARSVEIADRTLNTQLEVLRRIEENTRLANEFGASSAFEGGTSGSDFVDAIKRAIFSKESINEPDPYRARGPMVTSGRYRGEKALGKYQVMPGNLPQWSQQAFQRQVSAEEFLSNPQMQEALMNDQIVRTMKKYSNPADIISIWFTGRPAAQAMRETPRGDGWTSTRSYIDGALRNGGFGRKQPLGTPGGATAFATTARPSAVTPAPPQETDEQREMRLELRRQERARKALEMARASVSRNLGVGIDTLRGEGQFAAAQEVLQSLSTKEIDQQETLLKLRQMNVFELNNLRLRTLTATNALGQFDRQQKLVVDSEVDFVEKQKELNALLGRGTDTVEGYNRALVAQKEAINSVRDARLEADIEAATRAIKLGEEDRFRNGDPEGYRTRVLRDNLQERWEDAHRFQDEMIVLEDEYNTKYWDSAQFRKEVEDRSRQDRLEGTKSLYEELYRLDDEYAHRNEDAALRYAKAWKEARNDIAMADEQANLRSIAAIARIEQQGEVSVAQIRARVLEEIASVETLGDSIAGVFNQTFKVYTDDIDAWIDKTTDSMGNLGKIFNGFFKAATHRLLGGIQKTLLDAIFPEDPMLAASRNATAGLGNDGRLQEVRDAQITANNVIINSSLVNSEARGSGVPSLDNLGTDNLPGFLNPGGLGTLGSIFDMFSLGDKKEEIAETAVVASDGLTQVGDTSKATSEAVGMLAQSAYSTGQVSNYAASAVMNLAAAAANAASTLSAISSGLSDASGSGAMPGLPGGGVLGKLPFPMTAPTFPSGGLGSSGNGISSIFGPIGNTVNGGMPGLSTGAGTINFTAPLPRVFSAATLSGDAAKKQGFLGALFGKGSPLEGFGNIFRGKGANGALGGLFSRGASAGVNAAGGQLGIGALGNSAFASMLPMLGMQFGASAGGGGFGSMLGMAGGLLGGIGLMSTPGIFAAGGALSSLGPVAGALFSNPITAIIGGALLVGAIAIGRNKQRRRDETTRNQILGDSKTQLLNLVSQVQRDKMDGASALSQAEQIRSQYMEQVSQLKDKKTRDIAMATVRELDFIINSKLKPAIGAQETRREIDDKLIATYNSGGRVPTFDSGGIGRIKGGFDARDSLLVRVSHGETILTPHQAAIVGYENLQRARVKGYDSGARVGNVAPVSAAPTVSAAGNRPIVVINVMSEREAMALANKIPDAVIAGKAAADAAVNPMVLPAAVAQALSY